MSDSWWPEGTTDPAFQTQRQPYGEIVGGDYVRARSATPPLPQTALRYGTQAKGWDALTGKSLLAVRPFNYSTMEIVWGWPKDLGSPSHLGDTWLEVSLVRSAFGHPTTVNDGVELLRATRAEVEENYFDEDGNLLGVITYDGDGRPPGWLHLDGEPDIPLPNGRWYYYTVFFKTTPLDWIAGYSASSPLPKNYGHADHLWNGLPPWYQFQDNQQRADEGHLRQFLRVFGFELDLTREYVEQWQHCHHVDFSPVSLLKHLGANFDVPYESGLGDIRYRGLVGNIAMLYAERGTRKGLQHLIETASQYQCDVSRGGNLLLLPDDSEFLNDTGNWAATNDDMLTPVAWGALNRYDHTVFRSVNPADHPPPTNAGRGVMEITPVTTLPDPPWGPPLTGPAAGLPDFVSYCGVGSKYVSGAVDENGVVASDVRSLTPLYSGVAVKPGVLYGCSLWLKEPYPHATVLGLLWYGAGGTYEDLLSFDESAPDTPAASTWVEFTVQAVAPQPPTPGSYVIPYVRVSGTNYDRSIYVAGAMVYAQGSSGNVAAFAPDRYLTLGDPAEFIGADRTSPAYEGLLLGLPEGT